MEYYFVGYLIKRAVTKYLKEQLLICCYHKIITTYVKEFRVLQCPSISKGLPFNKCTRVFIKSFTRSLSRAGEWWFTWTILLLKPIPNPSLWPVRFETCFPLRFKYANSLFYCFDDFFFWTSKSIIKFLSPGKWNFCIWGGVWIGSSFHLICFNVIPGLPSQSKLWYLQ